MASEEYEKSRDKAAAWIEENAPDYVKTCIDEMHQHIIDQANIIGQRDTFIRDLCEMAGVDINKIFKDS